MNTHAMRLPLVSICLALGLTVPTARALDIDGDGVDDSFDLCCNTPPGVVVDEDGRPIGDLDKDCDNDLEDFQIFLSGHTGPMTPPQIGSCDDGDLCTADDWYVCDQCIGTPYTCDDSILCTDDECLGDGTCQYIPVDGECLINGTCYVEGETQPGNTCLACRPAVSQLSWTPESVGTACDDGDACTYNDVCDAVGQCVGDLVECQYDPVCESAVCNTNGECDVSVNAGWCRIAGVCVAAGAPNPAEECQSCIPSSTQVDWTNNSEPCSDGDSCTSDDICVDGTCTGTPHGCDDGVPCTLDICDGDGGCENPINTNACQISSVCHNEGDTRPGTVCQACRPAVSQTNWTPESVGTACDDGLVCTSNDACDGLGACVGDLSGCEALECEQPTCNAGGGCDVDLKPGWCRIAGTCYLDGTMHPSNECQNCNASAAPEQWSNRSGSCDDGDSCTHSDACQAGNCSGTSYSCADGLSCTFDICLGTGVCQNPAKPGACAIDSACYSIGETHPGNECLLCSASSPMSWEPEQAGTPCDDGNPFTQNDACDGSGQCVGQ